MERPVNVNEGLWEFCKYQNELLKMYKEYIEKTILVKILENYKPASKYVGDDPRKSEWLEQECRVLEVKIPESRFMMLETPNVQRQWEFLNWDRPFVQPEVYVNLLYKAAEEQKKNVETD
jgi:hypothetical protein